MKEADVLGVRDFARNEQAKVLGDVALRGGLRLRRICRGW